MFSSVKSTRSQVNTNGSYTKSQGVTRDVGDSGDNPGDVGPSSPPFTHSSFHVPLITLSSTLTKDSKDMCFVVGLESVFCPCLVNVFQNSPF